MSEHTPDADTTVATLANGVRVVTMRMPHLATATVSVFVRSGSQHESPRLNGISHFVEHMAFKGTTHRDCQRINLDAERLGADVNAHTDKDHTAFYMRGLTRHAGQFIHMLGDIVQNGTFPAAELERERQVILHEFAEDDDDALSTAFKLFDKLCFGAHPLAQPVIGTRRNIQRFSRDELIAFVRSQYTGANVVVGVAGDVDPVQVEADVLAAFGTMARGSANEVAAAEHVGGVRARHVPGSSQTHAVLGFSIPTLVQPHEAFVVAAALFGEGMSSPLMDELRERRGLVYHAACSADVMALGGQFVIEASTGPEHLEAFFVEVTRLLRQHTGSIDPVGLERARNQITVRSLRARERPLRRLEDAAQDLFVHGRVRAGAERIARLDAVTAAQVQQAFVDMLAAPAAAAVAGKVGKGVQARVGDLVGARGS
jgi:predicted Zn-dependent peptidase